MDRRCFVNASLGLAFGSLVEAATPKAKEVKRRPAALRMLVLIGSDKSLPGLVTVPHPTRPKLVRSPGGSMPKGWKIYDASIPLVGKIDCTADPVEIHPSFFRVGRENSSWVVRRPTDPSFIRLAMFCRTRVRVGKTVEFDKRLPELLRALEEKNAYVIALGCDPHGMGRPGRADWAVKSCLSCGRKHEIRFMLDEESAKLERFDRERAVYCVTKQTWTRQVVQKI
jgi:hypothetical protein